MCIKMRIKIIDIPFKNVNHNVQKKNIIKVVLLTCYVNVL